MNSMWVSLNYLYYELDPIGFVERLCENQEKPEMQCNGKCHLKKVAESQNKNEKAPENLIDFKELQLYIQIIETHKDRANYQIRTKGIVNYNNLYKFSSSTEFFHPPRLV